MSVSVISLLKAAAPEIFNDRPAYSTKVQKNSYRQPIPITPELRYALLQHLNVVVALDALHQDEIVINRQCLLSALEYQGVVYFSPLAWNISCTVDNPYFPRWSDADRVPRPPPPSDPSESPSLQWRAGRQAL